MIFLIAFVGSILGNLAANQINNFFMKRAVLKDIKQFVQIVEVSARRKEKKEMAEA